MIKFESIFMIIQKYIIDESMFKESNSSSLKKILECLSIMWMDFDSSSSFLLLSVLNNAFKKKNNLLIFYGDIA